MHLGTNKGLESLRSAVPLHHVLQQVVLQFQSGLHCELVPVSQYCILDLSFSEDTKIYNPANIFGQYKIALIVRIWDVFKYLPSGYMLLGSKHLEDWMSRSQLWQLAMHFQNFECSVSIAPQPLWQKIDLTTSPICFGPNYTDAHATKGNETKNPDKWRKFSPFCRVTVTELLTSRL